MKRLLLASALTLGTMTAVASAETTTLTNTQMDTVTAGKFAEEFGQGNINNPNYRDNPGSVTVSGPPGQINNDKFDCNNCTTTGPGNK